MYIFFNKSNYSYRYKIEKKVENIMYIIYYVYNNNVYNM